MKRPNLLRQESHESNTDGSPQGEPDGPHPKVKSKLAGTDEGSATYKRAVKGADDEGKIKGPIAHVKILGRTDFAGRPYPCYHCDQENADQTDKL